MRELYGIAAEFNTPEQLVEAARRAVEYGYKDVEAYSPFPIDELNDVIKRMNLLPAVVLGAGITGGAIAYGLQSWIAIWYYPLNVGGRPLNSWPAFIVLTFELTILFAAAAAFFGVLFFSGLPAPYHPLSNWDTFRRASRDGFFLCIQASDRKFLRERVTRFLEELQPERVEEIEK
jgi:hypothetical protein